MSFKIETDLLGNYLEDVAMGPFGSNIKTDSFIESGVPVIRGQNLYGREVGGEFVYISEEKAQSLKRSLAYPDDIVVTHRGTLGQVSIVPHGKYPYYLVSQSQLRVTPNKSKIDPLFLLYYLRSPVGLHELMQHAAQVGVPSIARPTGAVKSFKITCPALPQQRLISKFVDDLDKKIELNRKMNKTLEETGQALFKHYFIDNPEAREWEVGKLGQEFEIVMGQSPSGDTYNENQKGLPFYQGRTDFGFRFPSPRVYCTDPKRKAQILDTLISVRAPVGDINIADEECCIGRGVGAIRKEGFPSYTFYVVKSLQAEISQFDSGGTIFGSINKDSLSNIACLIPPNSIVKMFENSVNKIDAQIFNLSNQTKSLTLARDTLLPRIISGKIII